MQSTDWDGTLAAVPVAAGEGRENVILPQGGPALAPPPDVTPPLVRKAAKGRAPRVVAMRRPPSFLYPAIAVYFIFFVIPNVLEFVLAFTNWSTYHSGIAFDGLSNFQSLVTQGSPSLSQSIVVTIQYAVIVVVVENVVGLLLALALERPTKIHQAIRVLVFFPVFLAPLATGYAFKGVLEPNGPINAALSLVLDHKVTTAWLSSFSYSIVVVGLIGAWKFVGFNMTIFLAGLSGITPETIGAAKVDGATSFKLLRHIKLPMLAPALTVSVVLGFVGSLSAFDIVMGSTGGGPGTATVVLNVYVWLNYVAGSLGQATAVSMSLFVLIAVTAIPVIFVMRRRERVLDVK